MGFLFTLFYQPIANLLLLPLATLGVDSVVLGIIFAVLVTKIIVIQPSIKNTRMQIQMQSVAEDLKSVRKNIKDKKEQAEKTMEIYKSAGINPFSPLLLLLIQIPIFLSIFFVVKDIGDGMFSFDKTLYPFIQMAPEINLSFLSFNLAEGGNVLLALLVGGTQALLMYYVQKHITDKSKQVQKMLFTVALPAVAAAASLFFPSVIGMFWLINNLLSILQEILVINRVRREQVSKLEVEHP